MFNDPRIEAAARAVADYLGDPFRWRDDIPAAELIVAAIDRAAWKPISEAEAVRESGEPVMLWLGKPWSKVEKARFYKPWRNWVCGILPSDPEREEYHGIGSALPTHYQPLPAPPEDSDDG